MALWRSSLGLDFVVTLSELDDVACEQLIENSRAIGPLRISLEFQQILRMSTKNALKAFPPSFSSIITTYDLIPALIFLFHNIHINS
jgi:hypothetical protein